MLCFACGMKLVFRRFAENLRRFSLLSPLRVIKKVSCRGGDLIHGAWRADMVQRLVEVSNFPPLALSFSASAPLQAHQLDLEGLVSPRLMADGWVGGWAWGSIKLAWFSDKATGRVSRRCFINGADLWHFFSILHGWNLSNGFWTGTNRQRRMIKWKMIAN